MRGGIGKYRQLSSFLVKLLERLRHPVIWLNSVRGIGSVISIIYGAQVEEFLLGKRPFYMCEPTAHLCVRPIADDCAEFFRKDGWPSKLCASWLGASFTAVEEQSLTVNLGSPQNIRNIKFDLGTCSGRFRRQRFMDWNPHACPFEFPVSLRLNSL